jgi:3-oxoacyl-[acyl-carrier protein] reductase
MRAAAYGRVINIISTSVKLPLNGLGVSNTVRGAVASWAKTLANELGQYNITVNNILPGATATLRLQAIIENKMQQQQKSREAVEAAEKSSIPMRRFGEASEVANAVAFLASPAASYINGVNLPVDGGRTGCL